MRCALITILGGFMVDNVQIKKKMKKTTSKKSPKKVAVKKIEHKKTMTVKKKRRSHFRGIAIIAVSLLIIFVILYSFFYFSKEQALVEFKGNTVTRDNFIDALKLESAKYDPIVWKDKAQTIKIKKSILNDLIKNKLLADKAVKQGLTVTDKELETELASFKSGYTDSTFKKMLDLKGIKYSDWVEKKRNNLLVQKLINQDLINKIDISDEEISKYYNEHKEEFSHPEMARARHILVTEWNQAEEIYNKLQAGENFAALAKKNSISPERWDGGDLGYFPKGTHPKVFDSVCFFTPVGEISPIVKSEYGYHIFKIVDRKPTVSETKKEATPYINKLLQQKKSKDAFANWYQAIYDAADVNINEELLNKIDIKFDNSNLKEQ